jgi:hypothetical protein
MGRILNDQNSFMVFLCLSHLRSLHFIHRPRPVAGAVIRTLGVRIMDLPVVARVWDTHLRGIYIPEKLWSAQVTLVMRGRAVRRGKLGLMMRRSVC